MRIKDCVDAFTQTLKAHAKNIGLDTKITETDKKTILVNIIHDSIRYCEAHHIDYRGIINTVEELRLEDQKNQEVEDKKNALIWLQGNEEVGTLPCGCKLVLLDSDPAFVVCEKHKQIYREG